MKVLSFRPPWAWAILHLGKNIENRTWRTRYRGPILLHAGNAISVDDYENVGRPAKRLRVPMPSIKELLRGGIVGEASLVDIVEKHPSRFFVGSFGWVLENAKAVRFREAKGKLGLFELN
jgi:hypothetical protein